MRHEGVFNNSELFVGQRRWQNDVGRASLAERLGPIVRLNFVIPRQTVIGLILVIALLAFEVFNFDTTQFALTDLLGDVSFLGLRWATILAIAFCAIDFAGLAHLFTPDRLHQESKEVWYLMGAWLLGATMNALMTWWAISLTLLSHDFGNEVLSRSQLLQIVPVFVAVLVWLTRILFIGAFSVAGDHLFGPAAVAESVAIGYPAAESRIEELSRATDRRVRNGRSSDEPLPVSSAELPTFLKEHVPSLVGGVAAVEPALVSLRPDRPGQGANRVRQRPPRPVTPRPRVGQVVSEPLAALPRRR